MLEILWAFPLPSGTMRMTPGVRKGVEVALFTPQSLHSTQDPHTPYSQLSLQLTQQDTTTSHSLLLKPRKFPNKPCV